MMDSPTFTLRLQLPQRMTQEEAVELMGAAGCTHVLVGFGEPGLLALAFIGPVELREIAEVARTIPDAIVLSFASGSEARI